MATTVSTIKYGDHPSQIVHAWNPVVTVSDPPPLAVLLHGGWWRDRFDARLMDPLASDLSDAGWAVWNVEYRRTGADGGGWPRTQEDVRAALDKLAAHLGYCRNRVDPDRIVAIGHSAGGHLALLEARESVVTAVVALAPVTDLARSSEEALGEGAVPVYLGPEAGPWNYRESSPLHRLPVRLPQLVVHGGADHRVPVQHSRDYVAAARGAGDAVDYQELPDADHFAVITPDHPAWRGVIEWLG